MIQLLPLECRLWHIFTNYLFPNDAEYDMKNYAAKGVQDLHNSSSSMVFLGGWGVDFWSRDFGGFLLEAVGITFGLISSRSQLIILVT